QWSLQRVLPGAGSLAVVAKRPLANAPWRFAERPVGRYAETYWERLRTLGLEPADGDWAGTAVRFAAYAPGVTTAIAGTASVSHLLQAVAAVERGPLPDEEVTRWRAAYTAAGGWPGDL
ncbi:MAG: hypothetical protein QOF17_808, partial [Solirubrobacteraceae bacterium]|nr:hypothetical protein [Solirubrobacteraceae bacterium]